MKNYLKLIKNLITILSRDENAEICVLIQDTNMCKGILCAQCVFYKGERVSNSQEVLKELYPLLESIDLLNQEDK